MLRLSCYIFCRLLKEGWWGWGRGGLGSRTQSIPKPTKKPLQKESVMRSLQAQKKKVGNRDKFIHSFIDAVSGFPQWLAFWHQHAPYMYTATCISSHHSVVNKYVTKPTSPHNPPTQHGFLSLRLSWVLWQKRLWKKTVFFVWCVLFSCFCCWKLLLFKKILQAFFECLMDKQNPSKKERERESLKLMWFFYSGLRGNKCELLYSREFGIISCIEEWTTNVVFPVLNVQVLRNCFL